MSQGSANTKLNDRTLWFDGDVAFTSKAALERFILSGKPLTNIHVESIDEAIQKYNKLCPDEPLTIKSSLEPITPEWKIPEPYNSLNIKKFIVKCLDDEINQGTFTNDEIEARINRVELELKLWEEHELLPLLKLLIYIVDTFEKNSIVWGTGRGSSCCCYTLYLIGLHDVDSIFYNLDISEFFRD
jgi:DNA polymerase III alpha subunit